MRYSHQAGLLVAALVMVWARREALVMSLLSGHVSVLQLRFLILDGQADWPVVQVLVDGREAFVDRLPGWQGCDPADILGDQSLPSPDGRRVSWVDFRDYTGVFDGPAAPDQWAAPTWDGGGVMLSFENRPASEEFLVPRVLSLTSDHSEPEPAGSVRAADHGAQHGTARVAGALRAN